MELETTKAERLLRVIVSLLLSLYSLGVAVSVIVALGVVPNNIDAHVVRYGLLIGFSIMGGVAAIAVVCSSVWSYVNGKG